MKERIGVRIRVEFLILRILNNFCIVTPLLKGHNIDYSRIERDGIYLLLLFTAIFLPSPFPPSFPVLLFMFLLKLSDSRVQHKEAVFIGRFVLEVLSTSRSCGKKCAYIHVHASRNVVFEVVNR